MCQVDNGLLVGRCQVFYHQLVLIGEGVFHGDIQFAGKALFTIGGNAVQRQGARAHLTSVPYLGIKAHATAMQVVRTVVGSQLILFAVQLKLSFSDTVAPATNQCRQVRLLSAGELLDAAMTLNDVCYVAVFIRNHDSNNSAAIVRDCHFKTLTVLQDVKVCLLTINSCLEILAIQSTQILCFCFVCHIISVFLISVFYL